MKLMEMKTNSELFTEITEHLLRDEKPSEYINSLSEEVSFQADPLMMLHKLKSTEQSKKYHPEGNVWNHTMLVLDEAAKVREQSKDATVFMWAALLHDIGKPGTTRVRKDKITSYDHDKEGEKLARIFLSTFTKEEDFIDKVAALVRYHMHMLYVLKNLPYQDMKGLLQKVDMDDIALLCRCDRLGRTGADIEEEERQVQEFRKKLKVLANKREWQ